MNLNGNFEVCVQLEVKHAILASRNMNENK